MEFPYVPIAALEKKNESLKLLSLFLEFFWSCPYLSRPVLFLRCILLQRSISASGLSPIHQGSVAMRWGWCSPSSPENLLC